MDENTFALPNLTPEQGAILLTVIHRVQDLLYDEKHWSKIASARDKSGEPVSMYSGAAYSYCIAGAAFRAAQEVANGDPTSFKGLGELMLRVLKGVLHRTHNSFSLIVFNDTRSFEELRQLLANATDWLEYVARGELVV